MGYFDTVRKRRFLISRARYNIHEDVAWLKVTVPRY